MDAFSCETVTKKRILSYVTFMIASKMFSVRRHDVEKSIERALIYRAENNNL